MDLFHVDKQAKEVADTFAHCAHVLLLGVEPLDSVLRRVQGGQGAGSLFFGELKFSRRSTMDPCDVVVEGPRESKPYENKSSEDTIGED